MSGGAPAIAVVLNPAAGRGRARAALPALLAALRGHGEPFAVEPTTRPGEARILAREAAAAGCRLVVAAGGDGTVNEVANGLLDAAGAGGPAGALGIVHLGRGGDLARCLGLPADPAAALLRAVRGAPRPLDAGVARFADRTERAFLNAAGAGFDAEVARRAAASPLPGNALPYLAGILGALAAGEPPALTVEAGGERWDGRFRLAMVANAPWVAGGIPLVPAARPDDGRLDLALALAADLPLPRLLRLLPAVYRGRHAAHPAFVHRAVAEVRISAPKPVPVQLDGEVVGATPVRFSVRPGALRVAG